MSQTAIPCALMRGGTSKGLVFRAEDLPPPGPTRDAVLLAAMGSPDPRQVDGAGGAHPLTSKVAVVGPSSRPDADVDYLFLQVVVDEARVDAGQNCGNMLAAAAPFAIEEGLVAAQDAETAVRIHMVNTGGVAVATVRTPGGAVSYAGAARIDGVPGTAAPIAIDFLDMAGATCGALLPTGAQRDEIYGVAVTCIDNGMPVVLVRARDLDLTGYEEPSTLEGDPVLTARVEALRLEAGRRMGLGDVRRKTIPKVCLIAPPKTGGAVSTRTFIPHRVHEAIGVFGAVSVATACLLPRGVAADLAVVGGGAVKELVVEHPTGFFTVTAEVEAGADGVTVGRAALLRTARLLMRGCVYVPAGAWTGG